VWLRCIDVDAQATSPSQASDRPSRRVEEGNDWRLHFAFRRFPNLLFLAQTEERKHDANNDDEANQINDAVHDPPFAFQGCCSSWNAIQGLKFPLRITFGWGTMNSSLS
jgi:hypothetical protein